MTSRSDSTKQPGKQEEGFIDDPAAQDEPDRYHRVKRPETFVYSSTSADIPHSDKIDPFPSHDRLYVAVGGDPKNKEWLESFVQEIQEFMEDQREREKSQDKDEGAR